MPLASESDRGTAASRVTRCAWAGTPLSIAYHDAEWGVPVHDDRILFEFLTLEGAQAGLSWETVLKKRESYRDAFAGGASRLFSCTCSFTWGSSPRW